MRRITKGREPGALAAYRVSPGGTWEGFREKEQVLNELIRTQRKVCCYCGRRVDPDTAHVEHFHPQRGDHGRPDLQLRWSNLWAACPGGRGLSARLQHCDTRKGDQPCHLDPATIDEGPVWFGADGSVHHADRELDRELNDVLGLNVASLTEQRTAALTGWLQAFRRKHPGEWTREVLQREHDRIRDRDPADPFNAVLLATIRRKLDRLAR
ncbi:MAG: retron system putative HNH endonuclease [Myxococcota bacterium]